MKQFVKKLRARLAGQLMKQVAGCVGECGAKAENFLVTLVGTKFDSVAQGLIADRLPLERTNALESFLPARNPHRDLAGWARQIGIPGRKQRGIRSCGQPSSRHLQKFSACSGRKGSFAWRVEDKNLMTVKSMLEAGVVSFQILEHGFCTDARLMANFHGGSVSVNLGPAIDPISVRVPSMLTPTYSAQMPLAARSRRSLGRGIFVI